MLPAETTPYGFEGFVNGAEPRLRAALSATLGSDRGRDATADALAYGWEHWARVSQMTNPAGYLYAVGRDRGRRALVSAGLVDTPVELLQVDTARTPWIEPGLPTALGTLTEHQRVAVMLLHCFQWTLSEVAELLGVTKSTVQSHAERGMAQLRTLMGVSS